jgi:hypothetical protein
MGALGAEGLSDRAVSPRAWIFFVLVCIAAAIAYFLVQGGPSGYTAYPGACERLRAAGLTLGPKDWFCRSQASWRISYSASALVLGFAYVLPCTILARTGRRLTSFLPLLVGLLTGGSGQALGLSLIPDGAIWVKGMSVVALTAPVAAMMVISGPRRPDVARQDRQVVVISALVCGLATWGMVAADEWAYAKHLGLTGGPTWELWSAALCIGSFGLLLGQERRWWPWSLAPVTLLLSAGPSAAVLLNPERQLTWLLFGSAVPLAAIGLIWCALTPLVNWMTLRVARAEGREPRPVTESPHAVRIPGRSRPRLMVVLNALAAGALAVSVIVFMGDPLPAAQSTTLPTFLGLRTQAADARVKLDLRMAISALDEYAARHGSYSGFTAAAGASIEPKLAWLDGADAAGASGSPPSQTMMIAFRSAGMVKIAALSEGRAFCMERTLSRISYGTSQPAGWIHPGAHQVQEAISVCRSTLWTDSAVHIPDTSLMCDGFDPYGGYVTCRMVQANLATTLRQTKPG